MDATEIEKEITETYRAIFGREPDAGEKFSASHGMQAGAIKKGELASLLAQSDEYKIKAAKKTYNTNRKTINFYPVAVPKSGYGILGDNIYRRLQGRAYIITQSTRYDLPRADISLHLSIPPSWKRQNSSFNIGYTMFEASKVPDSWVRFCNIMDRLAVPIQANVDVFRSCGVKIPIDVVPIGVDETIFNPESAHLSPLIPNGAFKFLIVNDGQSRKNNEMVVKAFGEEFRKEISKNEIFLVTRTPKPYQGKNVLWVEKYLEDPDLANLIKSCDCVIGASCGEAGDIPVLEGMAMEKPVIVSREMAHSEYIQDSRNGFFIKTEKIVPAYSHPQYAGQPYLIGLRNATWILPSYVSLKERMRYVYENQKEAHEVGKNARQYILKNRTLDVCIKPLIKIFQEK
jgi:glycosyltransferase involved in cell wall biosynthesis